VFFERVKKDMLNQEWDDNEFPLAYLITIRTFGTWLHGDERGSVDRHGKNIYGSPRMTPNANLTALMRKEMTRDPFVLNTAQRFAVDAEIKKVCLIRQYILHALNVRTNHLHAVVSAQIKPESIIAAFKSNATRAWREQQLVGRKTSVWSRGKSRRYLWKPRSVAFAIDYTMNQQGENLVDFDTWVKGQTSP
jgi:REP element-mobilizing transposase RayT